MPHLYTLEGAYDLGSLQSYWIAADFEGYILG